MQVRTPLLKLFFILWIIFLSTLKLNKSAFQPKRAVGERIWTHYIHEARSVLTTNANLCILQRWCETTDSLFDSINVFLSLFWQAAAKTELEMERTQAWAWRPGPAKKARRKFNKLPNTRPESCRAFNIFLTQLGSIVITLKQPLGNAQKYAGFILSVSLPQESPSSKPLLNKARALKNLGSFDLGKPSQHLNETRSR